MVIPYSQPQRPANFVQNASRLSVNTKKLAFFGLNTRPLISDTSSCQPWQTLYQAHAAKPFDAAPFSLLIPCSNITVSGANSSSRSLSSEFMSPMVNQQTSGNSRILPIRQFKLSIRAPSHRWIHILHGNPARLRYKFPEPDAFTAGGGEFMSPKLCDILGTGGGHGGGGSRLEAIFSSFCSDLGSSNGLHMRTSGPSTQCSQPLSARVLKLL